MGSDESRRSQQATTPVSCKSPALFYTSPSVRQIETMASSSPRLPILVMFDIDGTLLQANAIDDDCYIQTAQSQFAVETLNSDWHSYPHVTNSGITEALHQQCLGSAASPMFLEQFRSAFTHRIQAAIAADPQSCKAITGAIAFLNYLRQRNDIALAIATGGWHSCAQAKLAHAQLPTSEIPFASASDAQEREVIMAIAHDRALAHYKISQFKQRIYIGDGVWDVTASQTAGYQFIGIATGKKAEAIAQAGAKHVFPNFSPADKILQTIDLLAG